MGFPLKVWPKNARSGEQSTVTLRYLLAMWDRTAGKGKMYPEPHVCGAHYLNNVEIWVAFDNREGECLVEEFHTEIDAISWLYPDLKFRENKMELDCDIIKNIKRQAYKNGYVNGRRGYEKGYKDGYKDGQANAWSEVKTIMETGRRTK